MHSTATISTPDLGCFKNLTPFPFKHFLPLGLILEFPTDFEMGRDVLAHGDQVRHLPEQTNQNLEVPALVTDNLQ